MGGSRSAVLFSLLVVTGSYISVESESYDIFGTIEDYKHAPRSKLILVRPEDHVNIPGNEIAGGIPEKRQFCPLCMQVTAQIISYLAANETQVEVISSLDEACSWLHSIKRECIVIVDEYLPLLFAEISSMQPEELCGKVALCGGFAHISRSSESLCSICHEVIAQILIKLSDPDEQLEIIELLLKGCSKVKGFIQECKRLVLHYAPLALAAAERLLEANDICTAIHVCKAADSQGVVASPAVHAAS